MIPFRVNLSARLGVLPNAFDHAQLNVTSPLFRSPGMFAGVRLLVALYTSVTLLVTLLWKILVTKDAASYFSFFTYLTYTGLCAYYFAAGTQTLCYVLRLRGHTNGSIEKGSYIGYPLQRWPQTLQALHVVLQATVISFPIVVTVVFWSLLADGTTLAGAFSAWSNISIHALNTCFALLEILGSNTAPPPWVTLPLTLILLVLYLAVAYITRATQGIYPYAFLDPTIQHGRVAAYIVGIALAQTLAFCAVRYAMCLRQRWAIRTGRAPTMDAGGNTYSDIEQIQHAAPSEEANMHGKD